MKKSSGDYGKIQKDGKVKNKITLNLDPKWNYYDALNKEVDDGAIAQQLFIRAFEKEVDANFIEEKTRAIARDEVNKILKNHEEKFHK